MKAGVVEHSILICVEPNTEASHELTIRSGAPADHLCFLSPQIPATGKEERLLEEPVRESSISGKKRRGSTPREVNSSFAAVISVKVGDSHVRLTSPSGTVRCSSTTTGLLTSPTYGKFATFRSSTFPKPPSICRLPYALCWRNLGL